MGFQPEPERHSQHTSVSGERWKLSSFSELLAAGAMGGRCLEVSSWSWNPHRTCESQNPWFCGQHPPHPSASHQLPATRHSQCALITSSQTWLVRLPCPKPTTHCGKCMHFGLQCSPNSESTVPFQDGPQHPGGEALGVARIPGLLLSLTSAHSCNLLL